MRFAQSAARHFKQSVGERERTHDPAPFLWAEAEIALHPRPRYRDAEAVKVHHKDEKEQEDQYAPAVGHASVQTNSVPVGTQWFLMINVWYTAQNAARNRYRQHHARVELL